MIWRISRRNSIIKWQGSRVSASRLAESNFRYTQGGSCCPGKRLGDLSRQPLGRRVSGHLEPQQLPPAVAQHQKREQSLKSQGRNHKQINGRDRLRVVAEECLPGLRRRPTPHHVFRYGRLGDLKPEHQQLAMNSRCSPPRVFPAHPSNEIAQLSIDLWPPCPLTRFPTPERRKTRTMPAKDSLRLNDVRRTEQARPEPGQPDH